MAIDFNRFRFVGLDRACEYSPVPICDFFTERLQVAVDIALRCCVFASLCLLGKNWGVLSKKIRLAFCSPLFRRSVIIEFR